jgi:hypothetical protein
MPANIRPKAARSAVITLALLLLPLAQGRGASSPFEIDLKELDKERSAPRAVKKKALPPAPKPAGRKKERAKPAAAQSTASGYVRYTVRQGDHIFRILMKGFGMSNSEAERLIPEVQRINDLADIRKLTVGRTLLIPTAKRRPAARPAETSPPPEPSPAAAGPEPPAPAAAPAPAVRQEPPDSRPAAAAAQPPVKIHSIGGSEPVEIVDALLAALSIDVQKNRIIESTAAKSGGNSFSVKVDRYFDDQGKRFIVNCTEKDPFNYTLLRLLEVEGYQVIQVNGGDNFRRIATRLLTRLNRPFSHVTQRLSAGDEGREAPGFMVTGSGADGARIFITDVAIAGLPAESKAAEQPPLTPPKASGSSQP